MMTTHVDRHRERVTVEGLKSFAQHFKTSCIPIFVEHDPRNPPIGRVAQVEIEEMEDGEHACIGILELFEPGDDPSVIQDSKTIRVRDVPPGKVRVTFDRSYRDAVFQQTIEELSGLFGTEAQEDAKKALEPLSMLTLGGAFALGAIAAGFFNALGSDGYEIVKEKVKKLLAEQKRRAQEREIPFRFDFVLGRAPDQVEVEVLITDPTDEDMDFMFSDGLTELDALVLKDHASNPDAVRLVYELVEGRIGLAYGMRGDGFPLLPRAREGE